ncbi:MAG: ABC transporter substrate-binding protein [Rhizobiaceae bacterium]|nr:ABC transporter substrate-binding protein [Rhizobiaceae bacterium]
MPLHGLSAFGDLKYPADFSHFGYVNPQAPKGGRMNFAPPNWGYNQNVNTFNTLNAFTLRGDAPARTELCFDTLMTRALDEPDALYGLIAESVTISEDRNSFTFALRPEARWHDGSPLTAHDCAFTYSLFKAEGHPQLQMPLDNLVSATATDDRTLVLAFDGRQSEQNILTLVSYPIVSEAYYTANAFDAATMQPPLGSGAYRIGQVRPGTSIIYERVTDYWGRDLPVNVGQNNFDQIRIDFYQDRQPAFEAFKKGDTTFRQEFTAANWSRDYNFPAVADGRVVRREESGEKWADFQGLAINTRKPQFQDIRVRRALGFCFDFEWTNATLQYGTRVRTQSFFNRSEFAAEGLPSAAELALLEPFRDELPPEAFGDAIIQPVSDGSGKDRKLLRQASQLLSEAGWKREGKFVVNDKGERLKVEFLSDGESLSRLFLPWSENMKTVGIDASVRQVDPAQAAYRENNFDFDLILFRSTLGGTPTVSSLENLYSSRAADRPSTRNYPGSRSPAVDSLIAAAGAAKTRDELIVALKALDRVLRARLDWIPTYGTANHWLAYWDMFGFVEPKPDYGFPVETLWWFDKEKAKAIGKA